MGLRVEPKFVIRGQDALAAEAIRAYLDLCLDKGLTEQAIEVAKAIHEFAEWRDNNRVKLPDHKHIPAGESDA